MYWTPIPSCPGYEINRDGAVRSLRRADPCELKTWRNTQNGYLYLKLVVDGRRISRTVHSLVAETFIGPRPIGKVVRHLDGDSMNNTPGNIAYGTQLQNFHDQVRHGTDIHADQFRCHTCGKVTRRGPMALHQTKLQHEGLTRIEAAS